ncbi:carboxylesterase family protein [Mucilaginibacter yixingensis]|uniref:Carboxylesterase family protein n=1 Tax=Mucilaginibacter yixingensis TaxID=1295612 RepID=A0A2T5JD24_9SPHI|nr:alpha/beta hydrolase [Mucilaginibacter yixingensis]PTQ99664.1 carboxylesterase family protein [Mucilaginibacter yixingensis]
MMVGTVTMAQGKRYKDLLFDKADVLTDQPYAADTTSAANRKANLFDLYTPHNDEVRNRPLIIWMHGGGFVFGSKRDDNIRLWSETFARRGYVCAAIDYRMGKKSTLFSFGKLIQAAYPAVLDARQAVRYFKEHAAKFGIDPNRIILAGNSAGAMMALQAAFSNNRELADSLRIKNPAGFGTVNDGPTKVMAVVNFWGGIYNINWLKNEPTPVVSVYGSKDKIVHPGVNKGTYGGQAIYEKAKALKRPDDVKVFEGYGHELYRHFNPLPLHPGKAGIRRRWLEAGQFAADFLAKLI